MVPHWLQNHWHRITPLHLVLIPISLVFRLLVAVRRDMYRNGMLSSVQLLLPGQGKCEGSFTGSADIDVADHDDRQQQLNAGQHSIAIHVAAHGHQQAKHQANRNQNQV